MRSEWKKPRATTKIYDLVADALAFVAVNDDGQLSLIDVFSMYFTEDNERFSRELFEKSYEEHKEKLNASRLLC